MIQVPSAQAVNELEKLLGEVSQGQDVIIIANDGTAFQLVALPRIPKPMFGSARGQVEIGPDFDDPIQGFEEYMQ